MTTLRIFSATALATLLFAPAPAVTGQQVDPPSTATATPANEETSPPQPAAEEEVATQESEAPAESFFATTTVTAVGHEVDAFQISTPVSVIPRIEIERKAPNNAAELLREQPGVDVNGVGPNQVRPVIRGPASVLYSSDAVGGVLNLLTRVPALAEGSRFGGSAELRYGAAGDLARAHRAVDGAAGALSFTLAGA